MSPISSIGLYSAHRDDAKNLLEAVMSKITLIAIIVPLIWVGWLILTEWVPMFPLNDLEASTVRERATTGAMNYTVGLVIAGGVLDR